MDGRSLESAARAVERADFIVLGLGAGMSTAAGLRLGADAVDEAAPGYRERYGIGDLYSGMFHPYPSPGHAWAFWARAIRHTRHLTPALPLYSGLLAALGGREWFAVTTNCDGQLPKAGFPVERAFPCQGDYGQFACSDTCCADAFDSRPLLDAMIEATEDFAVPDAAIPRCGAPLGVRIRSGVRDLERAGTYRAEAARYAAFLERAREGRAVFLELGVGMSTPVLVKLPFMQMAAAWPHAEYVCVNAEPQPIPGSLGTKAHFLQTSIEEVIPDLL